MINPGELNKRLTLITNKQENNTIGKQEVTVWCCKQSITKNEFYTSYQSGLTPKLAFKIRSSAYKLSCVIDFDGTKRYATSIIYDGTTYKIMRTYETDDIVELTCS